MGPPVGRRGVREMPVPVRPGEWLGLAGVMLAGGLRVASGAWMLYAGCPFP